MTVQLVVEPYATQHMMGHITVANIYKLTISYLILDIFMLKEKRK